MCRPTAVFERFFQEIGSRLIDQVLMLSNDCNSFCSPRFVARGEKTSANSSGTRMDEPNDYSEPFCNELQSLVTFLRLRIYFWIHAVLPSVLGRAFALADLITGGGRNRGNRPPEVRRLIPLILTMRLQP